MSQEVDVACIPMLKSVNILLMLKNIIVFNRSGFLIEIGVIVVLLKDAN